MTSDNDISSHSQLQHLVAQRLRAAILEGDLRPGQWLRQRQLAEEFNVSQMPVREALKELAGEGLVEHIPYRGVRVVGFSADDVEDLYAHRSLLEGMAAHAAALHITPDELAHLRSLHHQMAERLATEYLAEYRALNRQFHQAIIVTSRRDYLTRTLLQMWDAFPTMLWSNFAYTAAYSLPARDASDVGEHEAIILALEKHDALTAERLVRQHIEEAGRILVAVLRKHEQNED
jgi:DNA-binding GntR family transcriptional regulator